MKGLSPAKFESPLTRTQSALGWCYLWIHALVLPLLSWLLEEFAPSELSSLAVNIVYYALGLIFVFAALLSLLRAGFDVLADSPGRCALTFLMALGVDYLLSAALAVILTAAGAAETAPNNTAVEQLAQMDEGVVRALTIFIAPIVEETLFRGVAFGTLCRRSRIAAYAVSIILFSLYHVWQYAVVYADATLLLYAVQYIPVSFALAWSYERSGTVWVPIFLHMAVNAMAFAVMGML